MKKLLAYLQLTWDRLKSKTPPYFRVWGAFMIIFSILITVMDESKGDGTLPLFLDNLYNPFKFAYRFCAALTAYLATNNILLSQKTPEKVIQEKKEQQEILYPNGDAFKK